jgi:hypothetical protein
MIQNHFFIYTTGNGFCKHKGGKRKRKSRKGALTVAFFPNLRYD